MQKEVVMEKLRQEGCRITKQRSMLLDIILSGECTCCKEIYYKAAKKDPSIGAATVYRMMNKLEDIGAVSRNNVYKLACESGCKGMKECQLVLEDGTMMQFSPSQWNEIVESGLKACGYKFATGVKTMELEPAVTMD
ncbi:MAG: transcriptional repressor [Eubacterium sp.]|nr:transcriptional repressor [Eubacterium sp.]